MMAVMTLIPMTSSTSSIAKYESLVHCIACSFIAALAMLAAVSLDLFLFPCTAHVPHYKVMYFCALVWVWTKWEKYYSQISSWNIHQLPDFTACCSSIATLENLSSMIVGARTARSSTSSRSSLTSMWPSGETCFLAGPTISLTQVCPMHSCHVWSCCRGIDTLGWLAVPRLWHLHRNSSLFCNWRYRNNAQESLVHGSKQVSCRLFDSLNWAHLILLHVSGDHCIVSKSVSCGNWANWWQCRCVIGLSFQPYSTLLLKIHPYLGSKYIVHRVHSGMQQCPVYSDVLYVCNHACPVHCITSPPQDRLSSCLYVREEN